MERFVTRHKVWYVACSRHSRQLHLQLAHARSSDSLAIGC